MLMKIGQKEMNQRKEPEEDKFGSGDIEGGEWEEDELKEDELEEDELEEDELDEDN